MKVIELINKFSKEDIFNRLLELRPYIYEYTTDEEKVGIRKGFYFAYDDMNNLAPIETNEYVVVVCKSISTIKGEDDDFEVSAFKLSQSKEPPFEFKDEKFLDCRYDMLFSPWNDSIGREVCQRSLDLYGELDCACVIFHELVRMGFSNDYRTKRIEDEINLLIERDENLKEEDCIPAEEMFDKIYKEYFNETDEEREARHIRQEKEREENRPYVEWAITETQKELFRFKKYISDNY